MKTHIQNVYVLHTQRYINIHVNNVYKINNKCLMIRVSGKHQKRMCSGSPDALRSAFSPFNSLSQVWKM